MLNLDEAIIHCNEKAEELEEIAIYTPPEMLSSDVDIDSCKECASEHRQLAEWLRELKAYRKAEKEIEQELVNWGDIDNGKCRGLFLATSIIQHYKDEEVKADE